jgi:hypothetical protein
MTVTFRCPKCETRWADLTECPRCLMREDFSRSELEYVAGIRSPEAHAVHQMRLVRSVQRSPSSSPKG